MFKPIGIVHSPFKSKSEAPHQGIFSDKICDIEIFRKYEEGLKDIESFSHLIVIYLFHESKEYMLTVVTPWDLQPHGVFATRSPHRPNPIGFSVVELVERRRNILRVKRLDAIDGTPVLDIKPYIPMLDQVEGAKSGWLKNI
ncbi:MAG: tRNA (N6-threonylcarbamoyladenosine(37)-N6)-methyltransferase TrmO [Candidatus Bathyarchaeota archaeon]|nr:tRNA (N6-threonylcarbamoyladenosine(37)-N6)-methyltransferase TrmO [Candidatus Bathyarchaeota archaeon]